MMNSFGHGFRRLPSEHELDFYTQPQPTIEYQPEKQRSLQASNEFNGAPGQQHQPVWQKDEPSAPSAWTSSRMIEFIGLVGHLVLTLMPAAFIALAFLALSVDGDALSERGKMVFEAAKLGPSIFPIVFAAIVGRLMRTLALWRAERGSTLGFLEQLNGSQNLLAAVERSFLLSNLWGSGLIIILLWALSPLGGQSSLRVLDLSEQGSSVKQQVFYFDTENVSRSVFQGGSAIGSGLPALQAIFQACLLAPSSVTSSPSDLWGNVKIPLIQAQAGYTGSRLQDWIQMQHANDTVYSSLTGIIVSGLRSNTTAEFTVESSYVNLTCPDPVIFERKSPTENSTVITNAFQRWLGNVIVHNYTNRDPFKRVSGESQWNTFMVDSGVTSAPRSKSSGFRPVNIIFASKNVAYNRITAYNCSAGASRVESSIVCNGTTCRVERMRPSRRFTELSDNMPWSLESSAVSFFNFLSYFPWLTGVAHAGTVTPADYYVSGSNTPFQQDWVAGADYRNVSKVQVAQRLGALLNTAWQSSLAQSSIASAPPDQDVFRSKQSLPAPFDARNTSAVMQTTWTVYRANKLWIGFTGAISFILLACGIAGTVLRYLTTAPDILGYVSTMTRDNPFFHDQRVTGADALDGLERARLLRDVVVQISDVRPWQGSSHIALKSVAEGESRKAARLSGNVRASSVFSTPR